MRGVLREFLDVRILDIGVLALALALTGRSAPRWRDWLSQPNRARSLPPTHETILILILILIPITENAETRSTHHTIPGPRAPEGYRKQNVGQAVLACTQPCVHAAVALRAPAFRVKV